MNTRCVFCGHKDLQYSQIQYIYRHNGKFLIVNDVPCLQCTYCGEQYFEGHVLKILRKNSMRSISIVTRQVKSSTFLLNISLTFSKPNMPVKQRDYSTGFFPVCGNKITPSLQVLSASPRTASWPLPFHMPSWL